MQVSDDPRVGTELAGYRIESLLGLGGMSVVYLAEDLRLKRRVALKLLAAELAEDDAFRDRFLRESELAASIDHPNIVPIYEAGATDDVLFIAMRYVEGRDLKERLRHGRLDPADATAHPRAGRERAGLGPRPRARAPGREALERAARHGRAPRRVRPRLPGGLRAHEAARRREPGSERTASCWARSTTSRRSRSSAREVDGRADVYSLGCVLYECLVGEPPFRRDSELAVVFAHLETEPPAPSAGRPEVPAGLDAVIGDSAGEGAGAAFRELRGVRAGGPRGLRRRGEPAARGRRLACRRRPHRPDRRPRPSSQAR